MDLETLKRHPFVRTVLDDAMRVQVEAGIGPFDDNPDEPPVDERQFYVMRVGYGLADALTWVEQLQHAVHFLNDFGYQRAVQREGVTRYHHLIYNIENYLVRLQSIYDRLLQLTNLVFHICMSDELVNHSLVVSNLRVSRTKIPKFLRVVRKTIEPLATARNDIIHKHSYTDRDLRRLEAFYMYDETTWRESEKKVPYKNLKYLRSQLMKKTTTAKRKEFAAVNASLLQTLEPLFTELLAQYRLQLTRLNAIS